MIDAPTIHRLAGDLLLAHAEHDPRGIEGVQLVWRELDEAEQPLFVSMLQAAVAELAGAAIYELAELDGCTAVEVIDRLTSKPPHSP